MADATTMTEIALFTRDMISITLSMDECSGWELHRCERIFIADLRSL